MDYSELVRHDPRTLNTQLQGIGGRSQTINSLSTTGIGSEQHLDLTRRSFSLGLEDWVTSHVLLEVSLKTEDKQGSRLTGVGGYCAPSFPGATCPSLSGALLMLAEPVSSNTQQLEGKATVVGSDYSVTAGYYASYFRNDNGALQIAGINGSLFDTANAPFSAGAGANTLGGLLSQPVALAPDNQSYQMYLSGTYTVTPRIHTTFHLATTHSTQNEGFGAMGLTAAAGLPSSLNGVVDSTLAQAGVTARPLSKLSLLANVRYEDIDDHTPHALYGGTFSNQTNSSTKTNSKAEATYVFPQNLRGTLGVDYNWTKYKLPAVGSTELFIPTDSLTSIRSTLNEMVYRAELRKPLTDTLNGTLVYSESKRDGSHWINLGAVSATYPNTYQVVRDGDVYSPTAIFPINMMDRSRSKARALLDWAASDALSLQFSIETGNDSYSAPTQVGLKSADLFGYGVDASYAVTDNWKLTGFVNYSQQRMNVSHDAGYIAHIDNVTSNFGVGLVGKLNAKTEVGADLSYLDDNNVYGLGSGNASAPGVLPDVSYRSVALKLFGKYALDARSDVRVDLIHVNTAFSEWTWGYAGVPYAYSDHSTVSMQANQNVSYLGVKYVYKLK